MATVDGYDPQELEQQASLVEEAIAVALIAVAAAAAARMATPGVPVVSIDSLSIISTLWGERLDDEVMPTVFEVIDRSADVIYEQLTDLLPDLDVDPIADVTAADLLAQARNRLVGIGDVLWQDARAALLEGLNEGESIPELAARVRGAVGVGEPRARTIARTEIISVSNGASIAQARSAGVDMFKIWNATEDMRTRLFHEEADNQRVPLNDPFEVGDEQLDFPGDPRGRADNIINCRCGIRYDLDVSGQPVTAGSDRDYIRDEEGQFAETPGGSRTADKLKIDGRLPTGEDAVFSGKAKVSPISEFQFLGAAVDTPGGGQVRLGVAHDPKTWAGHNDPELQEQIDELKLQRAQMEELPEQEFDEDAHEALSDQITELEESQTDLTVSLTPEGVAQLQDDTYDASGLAIEFAEQFQNFYDDPQVAALDKEINRLSRSRPSTPETEQRISDISAQIDELAEERGVDLDSEREFGTGIIAGLDGYDLGWLVAGTGDGEAGWELSIAVRPPDAGEEWYPGGGQFGSKAVFGEDEVEKLDGFLFSLRQAAEGGLTTAAAPGRRWADTHLPGRHDQSSHGRKKPGSGSRKAAEKDTSPKPGEKIKRLVPRDREAISGAAALDIPPQSLADLTAKGDPRADALWYRTGDNSLETGGLPGFVLMNRYLRDRGLSNRAMDARIADIDAVMADSRLPQPVIVYRGLDAFGSDNAIGSTFTDAAYPSTSTDPEHAAKFGRTQARIRVPEGVGAVRMAEREGDDPESEILLDRNLTYRIVTDTPYYDDRGGLEQRILDLEVIR